MNPPPILEIDEQLLDLFKQACEKYLVSDNIKPEIVSIVSSILLGEQWANYECVGLDKADNNSFIIGLHRILPTTRELIGLQHDGRHRWNEIAYKSLLEYLKDEPYDPDTK